MVSIFTDLIKFKYLLYIQVLTDIKLNRRGSVLGFLWWFIEPLILMCIYYFVVGKILGRGGENFHVFVLIGLVPWQWFVRGVIQGSIAFRRNRSLITQAYFPLYIPVISPALVHAVFCFAGFFMITLVGWQWPGWLLLGLIPVVLVQLLLIMGISLFLSVVCAYVPDMEFMLNFIMRGIFYLSPILFDLNRILSLSGASADWAQLIYLNPFTVLVESYRLIFLHNQVPHWDMLGIWALVSLGIFMAGTLLVKQQQHRISKII